MGFLGGLPDDYIKSADWLMALHQYLENSRTSIPCYAMRKQLRLCVSSNLGEKANDSVVSRRQKHNGMAWSDDGSLGLASICATYLNEEMADWLHRNTIRFHFARRIAA